ncbi:hypothetical protein F4808DRAFT_455813 [Astrocystis sublimbata]|nr:hypothetical protein F4808DRAFT_455813 [Astrocystis sublimbata]
MAPPRRTILLVGATGQQGGAVLAELSQLACSSSKSASNLKVLALTRDVSSKKAQALLEKYEKTLSLEVIEGDTKIPEPIFAANKGIDTVFAYTTPPVAEEESQAKSLINAAARHGIKHFVFSSVDRGGDNRSWENPTDVPHFITKHNLELHLRKTCEKKPSMTYTILRPAAFMDNLNPTSSFGAVMASMWATMPADTKLQVCSVRDIGIFGAKAIVYPKRYAGRAIGIAGDELTLADVRSTFRQAAGLQLPQWWSIVGTLCRWTVYDLGRMFNFFETEGYGVDIPRLRSEEPRLQDFETWLSESSTFPFSQASQQAKQ